MLFLLQINQSDMQLVRFDATPSKCMHPLYNYSIRTSVHMKHYLIQECRQTLNLDALTIYRTEVSTSDVNKANSHKAKAKAKARVHKAKAKAKASQLCLRPGQGQGQTFARPGQGQGQTFARTRPNQLTLPPKQILKMM